MASMTSLPVILIKESITLFQSNLSESTQYVPVSEPLEPLEPFKPSEHSEHSEHSIHPKALSPYPVLRVSIPILNMYLSRTYSSDDYNDYDDCDEEESLKANTNLIRIWIRLMLKRLY
jgi:hypothetical protein